MRLRQDVAHDLRGLAGVDEVVDDEHAAPVPSRRALHRRDVLQHAELALVLVVVIARDADGLDQADAELARDDRGRHEPAARDRRRSPRTARPRRAARRARARRGGTGPRRPERPFRARRAAPAPQARARSRLSRSRRSARVSRAPPRPPASLPRTHDLVLEARRREGRVGADRHAGWPSAISPRPAA
jgi:hypothetical protein